MVPEIKSSLLLITETYIANDFTTNHIIVSLFITIAVLIIASFIIIIRRQYMKQFTSASVTIMPVRFTGTTKHTGSSYIAMDDKGTIDKKSVFVQELSHHTKTEDFNDDDNNNNADNVVLCTNPFIFKNECYEELSV